MANMFKSSRATNVKDYLEFLPEDRKKPMLFLHNFIQSVSPKLKSYFANNMPGYGSFLYKNYKKEIIDWPIVALASQKNYISVYVCALENGEYLAERYKEKLGNVSVGKSCIRFKKLEDVNLSELKKVLKKAVKTPGLVGADDYRKKSVNVTQKIRENRS